MPKLIIINGASGAGKTFLLEQISTQDKEMVAIKKYTTRKPREYENPNTSNDLYFGCTVEQVQEKKYSYPFKGHWYGIDSHEIDEMLARGKYPMVIVRDYPTIVSLKHDYGDDTLSFYIQGAYSGSELRKLLVDQGREMESVLDDIEKNKTNFDEYYKYLKQDLFDRFIFNYYDDSFLGQVEYFLEKDKVN